jgi:hypothetical protein
MVVEGDVNASKAGACTRETNSDDEALVTAACRRHAAAFWARDFGTSRWQLRRETIRIARVKEGGPRRPRVYLDGEVVSVATRE